MSRETRAELPERVAHYPGELSVRTLSGMAWPVDHGIASSDPEQVRRTNTCRAGDALFALNAYAVRNLALTDSGPDQMRLLLADLMHLADALRVDFDEQLEYARETYHEDGAK
jgi:hypothetical protein